MRQARISVIIPVYNEEKNIARLLSQLAGLLNKESRDKSSGIEIIVSDGGSKDGTLEKCRLFPVAVVTSARGRGRQLNAGAAKAAGDVLFFLHADSRVEPRVFDDIRAAVAEGRQWGCCTLCFDAGGVFLKTVAAASRLRALLLSSCYGDQGIFCVRDLFFKTGGIPEQPLLEDLCLSRRLRRQARAEVLPGRVVTSARRFRQGGLLRTVLKMQVIKLLFALGVPAERLAEKYYTYGGETV